MGGNTSKGTPTAASVRTITSLVPTTTPSVLSPSANAGQPAPAPAISTVSFISTLIETQPGTVSTVSFISTLIETQPGTVSTVRATETILESILISVTSTPTPTPDPEPDRLNPSSSSQIISTSAANVAASAQRAGATNASVSGANGGSTPVAALGEAAGVAVTEVLPTGKGPFAPKDAILGGIPNKKVDLPVTIVFLLFFMSGAAFHFARHEINSKKGHKFHLSDLAFDFCMVRTVTCTMRIVWVFRPNNNSVVLAALIFEGAGTSVLFAVNTFLTQRIIRAIHPKVGWSVPATKLFWALVISVPVIIVYNIINATLTSFLIKPQQAATIHDLVIFGSCWTTFLCTIPITFLGITALFPPSSPPEKFGKGGLHAKILILIIAASALTVGAVIRLVTTVKVRPKDDPGALNSKAVFYTTGFMLEIMVVALYALARFDLRFHVPDGCTGPGDYSRGGPPGTDLEDDKERLVEEVDVKMRVSVDSYEYRDEAMMSSSGRPISTSSRARAPVFPVSPTAGAGAGTPPRRPPRSMRWEGRERGGDDIDARSVI